MNREEILVFSVGGVDFGVHLDLVQEVVPKTPVTPVPAAPNFLVGLASVRGQILGVIDAALRMNLSKGSGSQFMVCKVRGNLTAIAIDGAVTAGSLPVKFLSESAVVEMKKNININEKFLGQAYELFELAENNEVGATTGRKFFLLNTDLFVSDEMAGRVGEVQ